jgi:GT2 family glycosyltransferase
VVDDASTDDSSSIAERFNCRIIKNAKNYGPARSRNLGARKARGETLFFLDSDTEVLDNTIDVAVNCLLQPGVDAVVGIYTKQPLNSGFFSEYYALLKYFGFSNKNIIQRYNVFSANCAAIKREVFFDCGGFKEFQWGVDIENEEFGRRIAAKYNIILNPNLQVRHHFGSFKKIVFIFNNRVYWWVRLFLREKKFEKALTTRSFGLGTLAAPFAILTMFFAFFNLKILWVISAILFAVFIRAYGNFFVFLLKEKDILFGLGAFMASLFFSFISSYAAFKALFSAAILRQKEV